jgi:hypothetical protein
VSGLIVGAMPKPALALQEEAAVRIAELVCASNKA